MAISYDKVGRPAGISGAGPVSAATHASNFSYRAFGLKGMSYPNGRTLSLRYDNRLRPTEWSIPGVLRRQYGYYCKNTAE